MKQQAVGATYVGPNERLKDKTALVRPNDLNSALLVAQFDDMSLVEAYGWWTFDRKEFSVPDWADPEDLGAPQYNV